MAETSTFVKIDRNIINWRWFRSANTLQLFLYLIISANIKDADFETITVHRGQLVTSYPSLKNQLGMSIQSVRTALDHLKLTGEVTVKPYPKFSVITIVNYDKYQVGKQPNQQPTNSLATDKQQATNSQLTTIKEYKELKNERSKEDISLSDDGYSDDFEIFWHEYPKKVGKKEAFKSFVKANMPVQVLLTAIREQKQSDMWTKENGRYIPNPATWLNQGRWDDTLPKPKTGVKNSNGFYTLKNGVETSNPFLAIYDEEFNNDERRNREDIVIVESSVS